MVASYTSGDIWIFGFSILLMITLWTMVSSRILVEVPRISVYFLGISDSLRIPPRMASSMSWLI